MEEALARKADAVLSAAAAPYAATRGAKVPSKEAVSAKADKYAAMSVATPGTTARPAKADSDTTVPKSKAEQIAALRKDKTKR